MSGTTRNLSVALASLVEQYRFLLDTSATRDQIRAAVAERLSVPLGVVRSELEEDPTTVDRMSEETIIAYFEFRAIQLVLSQEPEQRSALTSLEDQLLAVLRVDTSNACKAGRTLVGCFLLAVDELPAIRDRVLALLGSLTGRREGIKERPTAPPLQLSSESVLSLSKLLDYGLFGEVYAFLAGIRHLQRASAIPGLDDIEASIVSIASRKGGVGKSTLALAIALALLRSGDATRLCIIDLDITGPIWQYLLSPDGRTSDGRPLPYINELLNFEQPADAFHFGRPAASDVLKCVAHVEISSVARDIGLVTFADWPRTNRYLVQAIANNRESFTEFLVAVLRGLSQRYDFILIDNTPGLDPHPLITMVVAGAVPYGLPIMLSTPHAPDLRGTFLELSDLSLLRFQQRPLWIINKATEDVETFFSEERTLVDIAAMTRGYAEIMPEAPLLKQVLTPRPPARIVRPLPFDQDLARPNVVDFAHPLTEGAIEAFVGSRLFRRFEEDIHALLPRPSSRRKSIT